MIHVILTYLAILISTLGGDYDLPQREAEPLTAPLPTPEGDGQGYASPTPAGVYAEEHGAVYEGQVYAGTNWWVQRRTTVWGYSGTGAEQYDLLRGYGVYVESEPEYYDGIWWVYAAGWGWLRVDDLGYEEYMPPTPLPTVRVAPVKASQRLPVASGATPTPAPRPQPAPSSGAEDAIRTYFGDVYAWAVCVARKESGLNPAAVSPGGTYVGLFQVDYRLHGQSYAAMLDPYQNAAFARKLYNQSGTAPWPVTRAGC